MTFPFTCSACGHVNHFGWSQAGQKINCASCAKSMTVPVPMETVGESAAPASVPVQVSVMRTKVFHKAGARRQEDSLYGMWGGRTRTPR